jgi:prepilin-type N-terminal cleavage/methylation domain-containing protein
MRTKESCRRSRDAFTILELLLVMAVLVGVAAIGYSQMAGFGDSQRMARVADDLRGLITGLRVLAMEDQRTYLLAYRPETGDYLIRTSAPGAAEQESREPLVGPIRSDGANLLGPHRLEQEMRFLRLDLPLDPSAASSQIDLVQEGFVVASFEPDGTADDFSIGVTDRDGFAVIARLAGRTGRIVIEGPFSLASSNLPGGPAR